MKPRNLAPSEIPSGYLPKRVSGPPPGAGRKKKRPGNQGLL